MVQQDRSERTEILMPEVARPDAMQFSIRRAASHQPLDAVQLIEEYQDAVGVVVRDSEADILTSLLAADKAVWLAYTDDRPVGCVAFRKLGHMQRAGEVKRLYVRASHRGCGIAEALVKAVEHFAVAQGCTSLYLDTKDDLIAATRFYERMGYLRCDRYNDNPQATIFMQKELLSSLIIRPFEPKDAEAFRLLNEAWISTLFRLEPKDREVLNNPDGKIIKPGGQIFMAARGDVAIGCCALIAMGNGSFELAKMAVAEQERGRGAGRQILEWAVAEMRRQGVRRLYLETNSKLHNAIHLYEQVGFRHLAADEAPPTLYERADVFMEVLLGN